MFIRKALQQPKLFIWNLKTTLLVFGTRDENGKEEEVKYPHEKKKLFQYGLVEKKEKREKKKLIYNYTLYK